MPKFEKPITQKKNLFFFKFSPDNLIILCQVTKFEAPSCNNFWGIVISKFDTDPYKGA